MDEYEAIKDETLAKMNAVEAPVSAFIEALKDLIGDLQIALIAAEEDLEREQNG